MCRNTLVSPFTMTRYQAIQLGNAVACLMDSYERDFKRFPADSPERVDARRALDDLGDLRSSLVQLLLGRADSTLAALSVVGLLADSAIEEASSTARPQRSEDGRSAEHPREADHV